MSLVYGATSESTLRTMQRLSDFLLEEMRVGEAAAVCHEALQLANAVGFGFMAN